MLSEEEMCAMSKFDNFDDKNDFLGGFGFSDTGVDDENYNENEDDGSFSGLSYSNSSGGFSFTGDDSYEDDTSGNVPDETENKFNIPFNSMTGNNNSFSAGNNSQPPLSDSGFSKNHDEVFGSDDYVPLNNSLKYESVGGGTGSGNYSSSYSYKENKSARRGTNISIFIYIITVIMFLAPLTFFFIPTLKAVLNGSSNDVVYKPVSALVTSVEKDMTSSGIDSICSLKYNYNGKEYTDSTIIVHANIERGQQLPVYVNEANPESVSLTDLSQKGKQADPTFLFVYGFVVLLFIISAISFISKAKKREKEYGVNGSSVRNMKFGEKNPPAYTAASAAAGTNVHIGQSVSRTSSPPPPYKPQKESYAGPIIFIFVGFLFAIIGIIGLGYNIYNQINRDNIVKNGISVEATCTKAYAPGSSGTMKVNGKIVNYFADVKYEYNGKTYVGSHIEFSSQIKQGDTVAVYILESDPGKCYSADKNTAVSAGFYFLFGMFAFLGGIAAAVGIALVVKMRKQNRLLAQWS